MLNTMIENSSLKQQLCYFAKKDQKGKHKNNMADLANQTE